MKFSITVTLNKKDNAPALYDNEFIKLCTYIKSIGYNGIELAFENPDITYIKKIKNKIDSLGLDVSAIQTGQLTSRGFSFADPSLSLRKKSVNEIKKYIDIASITNSYVIIGLIRGMNVEGQMGPLAFNRSIECIKSICEYAFDKNVNVLLEPINKNETSIINRIEDAINLAIEANIENVAVLIDSYHFFLEESNIDIINLFKTFITKIKYVHISDSDRNPPGMGHFELSYFNKAIRFSGYNGYISAEIKPIPNSFEAAKVTYDFFKQNFKHNINKMEN